MQCVTEPQGAARVTGAELCQLRLLQAGLQIERISAAQNPRTAVPARRLVEGHVHKAI